ncbi:hypothetical protein D3C81_1080770 [compost metagenome]
MQTKTCFMANNLAMKEWRFVCSITPFLASTKMIIRSELEAPVTMFLVYWICPGASAIIYFRCSVWKYLYATSIVIPCSRSALSPSVNMAKSTVPSSFFRLARCIASNWSSKMEFVSYSNRPIKVLLPSSTEPAVINFNIFIVVNIRCLI